MNHPNEDEENIKESPLVLFGDNTLSAGQSSLDSINHHRMLLYLKRQMEANWLDEDTDLKSAGPERALGVRVPPLPLE
jgi:hypothetical protein